MTTSVGAASGGLHHPAGSPRSALLVLVAALAAGVFGYGGFGSLGLPMVALLGLTTVMSLGSKAHRASSVHPDVARAVVALGLLGVWFVVRGALSSDRWTGLSGLGLSAALALVLVLVHLSTPEERDLLILALLGTASASALAGWIGVVWRVRPLVLADQELWRASGSFGYPNALAGLLVPLTLLALARAGRREPSTLSARVLLALATCILLTGVLVAMSRIGLVLWLAGGVLLLGLLGWRRVLAPTWPALSGGAIAMIGLLPSIRETDEPAPVIAVGALIAGLVVAGAGTIWASHFLDRSAPTWLTPPRSWLGRSGIIVAPLTAASLIVLLGGLGRLEAGATGIVAGRATLSSSWRLEQHIAAWQELISNPWIGTGPGAADLVWTTDDGRTLVARYVHDGYVQVATELGVLGALLLAGVLTRLVGLVLASDPDSRTDPTLRAGAIAATAAFAAHSGFDFLWHIPVLPLIIVAVVASVSPPPCARQPRQ